MQKFQDFWQILHICHADLGGKVHCHCTSMINGQLSFSLTTFFWPCVKNQHPDYWSYLLTKNENRRISKQWVRTSYVRVFVTETQNIDEQVT